MLRSGAKDMESLKNNILGTGAWPFITAFAKSVDFDFAYAIMNASSEMADNEIDIIQIYIKGILY